MTWWRRLHVRLFASYAAVAFAGAAVLLLTIRLLVPALFDQRMRAGNRLGRGAANPAMHDALTAALNRSLLLALVVSLAVAAIIAAVVARRILRPIDDVRAAARRLAAGHYDERVAAPVEPELAALAADVNELGRSLADTERKRAQLVSDIAHELRTPLTTVRGYAEGMSDGVIAPAPDVLAAVLAEVDRLEGLARDLSTLSRIDEGVLTVRHDLVDVGALVADVVRRLRTLADRKGVSLLLDPAPEGALVVEGDGERLGQVVANLVTNAVTYTPVGGQVSVALARRPTTVVIAVTDTGVGLDGDDQQRVFDRFYRVEGVARPPGGSGIGLSIARAITRAHGGDVTASSPGRGRGTTFTVELPLHPHDAGVAS